ncbi:ABC transporter permease [Rhodococcus sp. NBC_00297]|uniref:ABC transporter permease n=1 Tax=Rhodococcus sp. NBC_00297 TaxID=2976005 RepID=UPI002E28A84A|nr:ABC transporter permease [Rhodococcus sp. NBC_00297]
MPVLLGVFAGVTCFSRDIESRTHVLGLTQSVSRRRWYWTRVLVVFVPITAAMVVLGMTMFWARFWTLSGVYAFPGTFDSRLAFPQFGSVAMVPAGYTAMGLVIGSTCALLVRHTVGAMIMTLVVTVVALVAFPTVLREHYATPQVERLELEDVFGGGYASYTDLMPGESFFPRWVVGSDYVDSSGARVEVGLDTCASRNDSWVEPDDNETTAQYEARLDAAYVAAARERADCLRGLGVDHYENRFHADEMFWRFQITETALCVLVAVLLAGASTASVRRLRP